MIELRVAVFGRGGRLAPAIGFVPCRKGDPTTFAADGCAFSDAPVAGERLGLDGTIGRMGFLDGSPRLAK